MKNRRKLLLALSGASAATVWQKPVVNAIMLPVHASTSLCTTDIRWEVTATDQSRTGGYGYEIWDESCNREGFEYETTGSYDITQSLELPPGTYEICAGFGVDGGPGQAVGELTLSCCGGQTIEISSFDTGEASGETGGCVEVVINAENTCSIIEIQSPECE